MPKDWKRYEAEIRQLYMNEGKTLKEVRTILSNKHGFNASVRAYRMRFDDWNLRKNNSDQSLKKTRNGAKKRPKINSNKRPNCATSSSIVRSPCESTSARNEVDDLAWRVVDGIYIPEGPLSAAQCLRLVEGCTSVNTMLEVLLLKWQLDGAYFQTAMDIIEEHSKILNIIRPTCNNDNIFHMIDETVNSEEKNFLTRACLRADADYENRYDGEQPEWFESWRLATTEPWDDVKEILREPCYSPDTMGKSFLDCALSIAAESYLEIYRSEIVSYLSCYDYLEFLVDEESRYSRRRYLEILDDEDCATFDNPELLRFGVTISKWEKEAAALAVSKNQLRASSEMSSPQPSSSDAESNSIETMDNIDVVGVDSRGEDVSTQFDQARALVDIDRDPVSTNSPTLEAFHYLASNWRLDQDIGLKFEIVSIFSTYSLCLAFGGVVIEFEEFFNLIDVHLPDNIKLPFAKAALTACGNICNLHVEVEFGWHDPICQWWWYKAYMSSSWEKLLKRVSIDEMLSYSETMTSGAAKLVRDGTLVLVAERFLKTLEASIRDAHSTRRGLDHSFFHKGACCRDYTDMLRNIRDEQLAVDPHFSEFLLDILEWQADGM